MKARVYNIMAVNTELNNETIKKALEHRNIKRYAYILHDKDDRAPHWHIVLQLGSAIELKTIAKWFNISENNVRIPKGNGAYKFLDCVQYLTHEKENQHHKYRYPDKEVYANFDWRTQINRLPINKKSISYADKIFYDVLYNGKTLRQCEEDRFFYMDNYPKLMKLRAEYIRKLDPPQTRINYYIYGKAGAGKDLMSRAIARALFPDYDNDEDIFFNVGASNSTFEGYDGQPVIIWSDYRSTSLLKKLGGRENFFNIFDTFPIKQRQNIKFSSINLCNKVNIINGQESFEDFLNNIMSFESENEEDKGQAYRRFPFIIPLHDDNFDILVNKGYTDGDKYLFHEYYEYDGIKGNMQKVMIACGGELEKSKEICNNIVQPIIDKHKELEEKMKTSGMDKNLIEEVNSYMNQDLPEPKILNSQTGEKISIS